MKEKKKRFKLFDTQREGRGVEKSDVYTKTDLKGFFLKYKESFSRLLSVNILMVLGNFPLIFGAIAMSTLTRIPYMTPTSTAYPLLRGLFLQQPQPSAADLVSIGLEGAQIETNAMTNTTYVFFALSALVIFTFGLVNVGTTYILRNMVKGDPVFVVSDFFYAIRRNWKQALPFGILDAFLLVLIPFDLVYLYTAGGQLLLGIFFGIMVVVAILYFWMRFYIYLQMVTFRLSLYKILKNSLIFALIGCKRNLMATLGIALLVFLNLALAFGFSGIFSAMAILLPILLLFSNGAFMSTYAAYYKIKEVMIDPYEVQTPDAEDNPASGDDAN